MLETGLRTRQMVEIAKALSLDGRIDGEIVILLDEPTSVLERREIDLLFGIIGELKTKASIIFISHRLDEVLKVSDRVYVLRDGAVVHTTESSEATITGLHEHMVGRQLDHQYYRENKQREALARRYCRFAISRSMASSGTLHLTLRRARSSASPGSWVQGARRLRAVSAVCCRQAAARSRGRQTCPAEPTLSCGHLRIWLCSERAEVGGHRDRPQRVREHDAGCRWAFFKIRLNRIRPGTDGVPTLDRETAHPDSVNEDADAEPVWRQPAEGRVVEMADFRIQGCST